MGHDRRETTGEHGTQSHSANLTMEQERVSRDTYGGRIGKQYGTIMHKQDMHERTSYTSFHFCQHIGQPFSDFWQIVLSLYLVDTIRLCSRSVYLQKTWLSLPKSAECHLSWIHNYSSRATYITPHTDVLFFKKNLWSNFILEKVFEALFPHLCSDTTCDRTA